MHYEVEINGRTRHVVVRRTRDGFEVALDGAHVSVDAIQVAGSTLSLLVGARTYDVTVTPDVTSSARFAVRVGAIPVTATLVGGRRFGRRDEETHAGTGPERIVAPMPGKIVRVLVKSGEAVRARQPVVVIEAMKMENELRARRDGTAAVHASPGASVEAGALLVVIQ